MATSHGSCCMLLALIALISLFFHGSLGDYNNNDWPVDVLSNVSFEQFVHKYNKTYASSTERLHREAIFLQNQLKTLSSRAEYLSDRATMYLSINEMSDLTAREFRNKVVGLRHPKGENLGHLSDFLPSCKLVVSDTSDDGPSSSGLDNDSGIEDCADDDGDDDISGHQDPQTWESVKAEWRRRKNWPGSKRSQSRDKVFIDHRPSGCLNVARFQGECSSCSVFSTIGLYEWAYCKQHRTSIDFSEQYVLDCAQQTGVSICQDGIYELDVSAFVQDFGFELADPYVYRGIEFECPYGPAVPSEKRGLLRLDRAQLIELPVYEWDEQLELSPIVAAFYLDDNSFANYGGGVDQGSRCNKNESSHSMLVVGSGRERGLEYWLIRNSHGESWGDHGYYKLKKASDCYSAEGYGLTMEAFYDMRGSDKVETRSRQKYRFYENPQYDKKILAKELHLT